MEPVMLRSYWACEKYWWPFSSLSGSDDAEGGVRKNVSTMEIHHSNGVQYYLPAEGKDGDYCEVWQSGYHPEGWWRSSVRAEWRYDRWIVTNCEDGTDCDGRVTDYLDWEVRRVADGVQKTLIDSETHDQFAERAGY